MLLYPACILCSNSKYLCYVGHVRRMEGDRSPKDLLYCLSTVVRDEIPGQSSPKLGSCLQARQTSDVDTSNSEKVLSKTVLFGNKAQQKSMQRGRGGRVRNLNLHLMRKEQDTHADKKKFLHSCDSS